MSVTTERVRVVVQDHVAVVTMTRPEKHNALDIPMFQGLVDAADEVAATPGVRAVVLHGDGPSFCSGIDIAGVLAAQASGEGPIDPLTADPPNFFQRAAYGWIQVPVPVIAAVHGNCLGGGFQIALGADLRISTPDARMSVMEVKWGLVPDMSITRTLTRLVRLDVAKELTYTHRVFSGQEGLALGVVTRLSDDPLADAMAMAREIATKSPDAIRGAKRLFDEAWTGTVEETLGLEASIQLGIMGAPNQMEAVRSGMMKEPGNFADPGSAG